jgi:hypothetical protein
MFDLTLSLGQRQKQQLEKKDVLNVTDQGIKNQGATASLVQPIADNQSSWSAAQDRESQRELTEHP